MSAKSARPRMPPPQVVHTAVAVLEEPGQGQPSGRQILAPGQRGHHGHAGHVHMRARVVAAPAAGKHKQNRKEEVPDGLGGIRNSALLRQADDFLKLRQWLCAFKGYAVHDIGRGSLKAEPAGFFVVGVQAGGQILAFHISA